MSFGGKYEKEDAKKGENVKKERGKEKGKKLKCK
jgi:hypothetical protein